MAGEITGAGGSPQPVGFSLLGTMWTDIHCNGGILYKWRSEAVPITLFYAAVFERDRSMGHQLHNAKTHATLHLALDRQRIDGESWVHSNSRAMDSWAPVFD